MANLSKEVREKRENFVRKLAEKQKGSDASKRPTFSSINEAVAKEFPKLGAMRFQTVKKIVDDVFGAKKKGAKTETTTAPTPVTTAARSGKKKAGAVALTAGMFVVTGDVDRAMKLCEAAGLSLSVHEPATQALMALRA